MGQATQERSFQRSPYSGGLQQGQRARLWRGAAVLPDFGKSGKGLRDQTFFVNGYSTLCPLVVRCAEIEVRKVSIFKYSGLKQKWEVGI